MSDFGWLPTEAEHKDAVLTGLYADYQAALAHLETLSNDFTWSGQVRFDEQLEHCDALEARIVEIEMGGE